MDCLSTSMLTGNGQNRWADKPLNMIVSKNGQVGGTGEHSVVDGAEFAHILENMLFCDYHFLKTNENEKNLINNNKNDLLIEKLEFEICDEVNLI